MPNPRTAINAVYLAHLLCSPFWFVRAESFSLRGVAFLGLLFAQASLLAFGFSLVDLKRPFFVASILLAIEGTICVQWRLGEHDTAIILYMVLGSALLLSSLLKLISITAGLRLTMVPV